MKVRLVWITPDAEGIMAYCARVSNPKGQDNPEVAGLYRYCLENEHWSVFETANACFEIGTSRAITAQIARHRSFSFQEFSQRYSKVQSFEDVEVRRQDVKNRQNSIDDLPTDVREWWKNGYDEILGKVEDFYDEALDKGIAKECARMVLPMATTSRMYMNGTIRSWLTYIRVRTSPGTQKEHRDIALAIRDVLVKELPDIAKAMKWV